MPEDPAAALAGRQVVVTGAAGFLGGRLLARLAASGGRPVGLDRRPLGAVPPRASAMVADLRGSAAAGVLQTADIVFHLAAANGHAASMENPLRDFEDNVNATLGLLRVVGPRTRVVFTGTRQLYGAAARLPVAEDHPLHPPDAHAVHKEAAERLGRWLLGDRFRVLRLSNAYGPGQPLRGPGAGFTGAFLGAALAGEEIRILGNPALRRDPVYVDDLVDALLRAAASGAPAGPWNVGGPAVTLRDFAVRLGEAAGRPVRIRVEPLPATQRAIAVDDLLLDTSRIRRDLGWRASTPLDAGLRATVAWFRRRRAPTGRTGAGLQSGNSPRAGGRRRHRENWWRAALHTAGPPPGELAPDSNPAHRAAARPGNREPETVELEGMRPAVPFIRLATGEDPAVRSAVLRVLDSGRFILGPEVEAFEAAFAASLGVRHVVGVASGTDALTLSLAAHGVGPGDRVLTSALSAGYTAVGIRRAGATPVFCDVEPGSLGLASAPAAAKIAAGGIRAVVPVHLYGAAPPGFAEILQAAADHDIPVIEDACQAHGGRFDGRSLGSLGAAGAFSFYPTKNLGAVGDGGAVATDDADLAARVRRLRFGGQVRRHLHRGPGWNSRLDELQAAVLSALLPRLDEENRLRRQLARRLRDGLDGLPLGFVAPPPGRTGESACHLFVVSTPRRDALRRSLAAAGVETLIHYPVPLPLQPAFRTPEGDREAFPEAVRASARILSLPLHPGLHEAESDRIVGAVRAFFRDERVAE